MKNKLKKLFMTTLLFFAFFLSFSESFEFVNKDFDEILYAISMYKNLPVSADDTVSGKGNFRLSGDNFDESFDSFLVANRLYVEKTSSRWIVSKVRFQKNEDFYSLDACDVTPTRLFEYVAQKTGICITYQNLPQLKISIHTGFCSVEEIIKRIAGLCFGFEAKKTESGFYNVSRAEEAKAFSIKNGIAEISKNEDDIWECNIQNAPFSYVCEKLFSVAKKEYCFSLTNDNRILRANFLAKDFDEMLSRLCVLSNADFVKDNEIYILLNSKNKEKINENGKAWNEIEIKNMKIQDFLLLSSKRFPDISTLALDSSSSTGKILFLSTEKQKSEYESFLKSVDKKNDSKLVKLKYIQTSEFLKNLPPFVEKTSVADSGRGDSFYFTGTEESYKTLISHIHEIDKPISRISYDLLIMQYQDSDGSKWSPNFRASRVSLGDQNSLTANLGSVLDLNLDVISAFGMKFAVSLQSAITSSKAKVFADTTLNGVSGSTINFQNTNTYRYRDNNLDPETGKPIYSGVTKEIKSGLQLDINGIVTGDGMITSKITASVSSQGTDLSSTTGNPPPSSEKVITTEVRGKSGEPIVLSGLIQEEEVESISRIPFLSKIPLVGRLFKSTEKSKVKNEFVIYLVPSAELFENELENTKIAISEKEQNKNKMKALFGEFVK